MRPLADPHVSSCTAQRWHVKTTSVEQGSVSYAQSLGCVHLTLRAPEPNAYRASPGVLHLRATRRRSVIDGGSLSREPRMGLRQGPLDLRRPCAASFRQRSEPGVRDGGALSRSLASAAYANLSYRCLRVGRSRWLALGRGSAVRALAAVDQSQFTEPARSRYESRSTACTCGVRGAAESEDWRRLRDGCARGAGLRATCSSRAGLVHRLHQRADTL